jgi:hypothetical protein
MSIPGFEPGGRRFESGRATDLRIENCGVAKYCSKFPVRTPDRQHGEFDKSPQAIWSPAGRAERERGQGAAGPAAIRPGALFNQALARPSF